jgi:ParB family protein of integrating conjugative element (PFGI_1 class)
MKQRPDFNTLINNATVFISDEFAILPDPTLPTRIRVNLTQVIAFKNNPRKTRNPKFDEIKDSIRSSGLDTPPDVTREKPGDPYMIRNGGNTRLEILNELYNETGDKKFFEFDCIFHPWTDDFDLFIRHVKENEMRGQMSFIERALAARKAKDEIEKIDNKGISLRDLSKRLTDKGWPMDYSNLGQLLYAEEKLLPIIPKAFWELGIGRPAVKEIRKLLEHCESYWKNVATESDGVYEDTLKRVCSRVDGEAFTVERLEYELCGEIARTMGGTVASVQSQIQALAEKIIEPAALTRPSTMDDISNLPVQSFSASIAKSKAANLKEKEKKSASQQSIAAQSTAAPAHALLLEQPPYIHPAPGNYDYLNSLDMVELKQLAFEKIFDCFTTFDTHHRELCELTFLQRLIHQDVNSTFGFTISIPDQDIFQQLAQDENLVGQLLYFISLMSDTQDQIKSTQHLYRQSGSPLVIQQFLSDGQVINALQDNEFTTGYLINFLHYRLQMLIPLTINVVSIYPWVQAMTECEYVMAALMTYNGYAQG